VATAGQEFQLKNQFVKLQMGIFRPLRNPPPSPKDNMLLCRVKNICQDNKQGVPCRILTYFSLNKMTFRAACQMVNITFPISPALLHSSLPFDGYLGIAGKLRLRSIA